MRSYTKGFTLIELLIVIAIIGILAILVLGAAGRSRGLALDRKVQNGVGQIRWQAEIAYDNNGGSYEDWVEDSNIQEQLYILLDDINSVAGITTSCGDYTECPEDYSAILRYSQEQEYCISAPKPSEAGRFFCIDHQGTVIDTTGACPDFDEDDDPLRCPTS